MKRTFECTQRPINNVCVCKLTKSFYLKNLYRHWRAHPSAARKTFPLKIIFKIT